MMGNDLNGIAEKHGILLALRFGSSVMRKTHARSDVDIAVLLDRSQITFRDHLELLHDMQQVFSEREVDLAILNHADPLFLKKITDHCEILYGPPERLQRLRIYAFKRFQDHRKYFDMERRYAAAYLATTASAQ